MSSFYYTHRSDVDSSFVNTVWYAEGTKELVVQLNDYMYLYQNVPLTEYNSLVDPKTSAGRVYSEISRNYGPSARMDAYTVFVAIGNESPNEVVKIDPRSFAMDIEYVLDGKTLLHQVEGISVADAVAEIKTDFANYGLEILIKRVVVYFNE